MSSGRENPFPDLGHNTQSNKKSGMHALTIPNPFDSPPWKMAVPVPQSWVRVRLRAVLYGYVSVPDEKAWNCGATASGCPSIHLKLVEFSHEKVEMEECAGRHARKL